MTTCQFSLIAAERGFQVQVAEQPFGVGHRRVLGIGERQDDEVAFEGGAGSGGERQHLEGAHQVDRVDTEAPQNRCYRLTEASPCENGGERRDKTLARMTHRHFAIFRTRVKPYRAYSSSGPVCR
jgi:hypothetical protein